MRYILVLVCIVLIFLHHFLVFDQTKYKTDDKLWKNFPIENSYVKYFWQKNENPTYVFSTPIIAKYSDKCYREWKNCSMFVDQELYADFQWLSSIQYIGTVIASQDAPYLYPMLDDITNISPYWEYPYSFGQLLLPISNYEQGVSKEKKKQSWINTAKFGEKWIKYICDKKKIDWILALTDGQFWDVVYNKVPPYEKLKNPCKSDSLAQYLAFLYYHDLKDLDSSVRNYKIASFQEWVPSSIIGMVSVVSWILWEHEKATFMFLQKLSAMDKKVKNSKTEDEKKMYETKMKNSFNRLIVENQFYLLWKADNKECLHNYKCLVEKGYLAKTIQEQILECRNNKDLKDVKTLDDIFSNMKNLKKSSNVATCWVLSISLANGYITSDGKFVNAVDPEFTYYWDYDNQDWWMWKRD